MKTPRVLNTGRETASVIERRQEPLEVTPAAEIAAAEVPTTSEITTSAAEVAARGTPGVIGRRTIAPAVVGVSR